MALETIDIEPLLALCDAFGSSGCTVNASFFAGFVNDSAAVGLGSDKRRGQCFSWRCAFGGGG